MSDNNDDIKKDSNIEYLNSQIILIENEIETETLETDFIPEPIIIDTDKATKIAKPNKFKNVSIAIGIALVILLIIYLFSNSNKTVPITDAPNDIITESDDSNIEVTEENTTEEIVSTEEETPTEEIALSEEQKIVDSTITNNTWTSIDKVIKNINEYLNNPTITNRLISNGGYLYNVNIDEKVDILRVIKQEDYPDLNLAQSHILYIYPKDLKEYEQLRITDNAELEIFYAYKTDEGYAISSANSGGGILTYDQFDQLIGKYTSRHSEIVKPHKDDGNYMELEYMALMAMLDGSEKTTIVDTRFVQYDEDYSVIVTSLEGEPENVQAFLFEKIDDNWEIVSENFHRKPNYYKALNKEFPYMNIELLPKYDLDQFKSETYVTDLQLLIDGLISTNQLNKNELPMHYGVGVFGCYYMEFTSGRGFIGVTDSDNSITTYPVNNMTEVESVLDAHVSNPPYIIFKQY